jgi:hypothetical protein
MDPPGTSIVLERAGCVAEDDRELQGGLLEARPRISTIRSQMMRKHIRNGTTF